MFIFYFFVVVPVASVIQFEGVWFTWGQVATSARQIAEVSGRGPVGIMLRNEPVHVAALLGVLAAGGTVVVINPSRGDERTRADVEALQLPVIIGLHTDLAAVIPPSSMTTRVAIRDRQVRARRLAVRADERNDLRNRRGLEVRGVGQVHVV